MVVRSKWLLARINAKYRRLLAVLGLTVIPLALGAWLAGGRSGPNAADYVTAQAARGDIEQAITALATLQPSEYVDVGAQVSGQLRKIHVKPGSEVEQGQLLAEIDPTIPLTKVQAGKAQLQNYRAQLAERRAQFRLAEQMHQRQRKLLAARATSEETAESAETTYRAAQSQIAALEAQIEQTESTLRADEASLGYTRIYAPISGTVLSLTARQGQTLNANQQAPVIMRIADLSTMTVLAQVSEADVGRLQPGMDAYFTTLGRGERRWYGKLRQILPNPEVINNVVLFNAQFDVANEGRRLLPQMSAQVFFVQAAAHDAVLVPAGALSGMDRAARNADPGAPIKARVKVVADGGIEEREVAIGVRTRVQAQVVAGLSEGEEVIIGLRADEGKAAQSGPSSRQRMK